MVFHDTLKSKKFWFASGVVIISFIYALLAAIWFPALGGLFETFSGIVEFVTAAYLTGNVANKFVAGKFASAVAPEVAEESPEASPDPEEKKP